MVVSSFSMYKNSTNISTTQALYTPMTGTYVLNSRVVVFGWFSVTSIQASSESQNLQPLHPLLTNNLLFLGCRGWGPTSLREKGWQSSLNLPAILWLPNKFKPRRRQRLSIIQKKNIILYNT